VQHQSEEAQEIWTGVYRTQGYVIPFSIFIS
jgi:hypothetical protein